MSHVIQLPADEIEARIRKIPGELDLETIPADLGAQLTAAATKIELSNSIAEVNKNLTDNFYNKTTINDTVAALETKNNAAKTYYTKTDFNEFETKLNTTLEGKADESHYHSQYLTEHQSLSDYAKSAELGALAKKDSLSASDVGAVEATTDYPTIDAFKTYVDGAFVLKEANKGLSTNDFNNTYKTKLEGIPANATHVEITTELNENGANKAADAKAVGETITAAIKEAKIDVDVDENLNEAGKAADAAAVGTAIAGLIPRVLPEELEGILYGDILPGSAEKGQVFFLKIRSV